MKLLNTLRKAVRMEKQMVKHFLLSKNFWVLNKHLVKTLGIETAFLLSVFADADERLSDSEGWFYQTVETIEGITTLNRYKQDLAIDLLIEKGVLEKTHKGMPRKRYFRIDSERLAGLFVEGQQYSTSKVADIVSRRSATSKELSNKELNNKELSNKDIVEQSSTTYPFSEIIDYLNEKAETQYRASSKKTQSLIKARVNEGFTLDDFKTVIDKKTTEWKSDNKMNQYLRPETLFGTKFESYLNQKIVNPRSAESGKMVIKKAHDEKPPEVKLTPEERAAMIKRMRQGSDF